MDLASELRRMGLPSRAGFFLHTPFPPLEIFLRLPWRFEILRNLLEFDPIGFQTLHDRRNFLTCIKVLFNVRVKGTGSVVRVHVPAVGAEAGPGGAIPEHSVSVGAFPIGIDFQATANMAMRDEVRAKAAALKADIRGRQMILGVDRLDYTKGLPNKLQAFRNALHRYPELHHRVNLVQHVVPSRKEIPDYQQLRLELEHLIGQINGEFTESGWVPIHYMFHHLGAEDLAAYYLAADIALITSLKDGMNLVAKEYCAAQIEHTGVLILSEFAGAAAQLQRGALLVNPYDIDGVAAAIQRAFTMPEKERRERMRLLRRTVRNEDVYRWADAFLGVTTRGGLAHVPYPEDYLPSASS
jgi:trehalose 6-phosphate synthase